MIQMNEREGISAAAAWMKITLDKTFAEVVGEEGRGGGYGTDCSINMTAGLLASRL